MKKRMTWALLIFIFILCLIMFFYYLLNNNGISNIKVEGSFAEIFSIFVLFLTVFIEKIFAYNNEKREKAEAKEFYENIRGSVILKRSKFDISSVEKISGENTTDQKQEVATDILELMLANMKEIKDYYVLSKTQAKNSFGLAVIMCIMGFVLMGISVAAAFLNSSNLVSTIVPAVGAAIVEIIAGTSLIVYRKSLDQLNRYYNSLHSNERFLSMVNIVSKVSVEKQDDVYIDIIRSQIALISTGELTADKSN